MRFVPRAKLPHETPPWISSGSLFFITLHCATRASDQLTQPEIAPELLESVVHFHTHERWFARLFLLMPDHLHALLAFPKAEEMRRVISDWKRYAARNFGIEWQRDFFDHRVRERENWQLKADYIRENPVRKGLVARAEDWPWVFAIRD